MLKGGNDEILLVIKGKHCNLLLLFYKSNEQIIKTFISWGKLHKIF